VIHENSKTLNFCIIKTAKSPAQYEDPLKTGYFEAPEKGLLFQSGCLDFIACRCRSTNFS